MKLMSKFGGARTIAVLFLLVTLWPMLVLAQTLREAGVVTTLSGKASVARVSLPQSLPLHFKDPVYLGDKVSTAEDSIARVLLGGKALVTIRELSIFTVTEEVGKSTVDLARGKLSLAVAHARMKPGEQVEVRTPNAIAAVRGTVLVVEVEPAPTAATTPGPAVFSSTITVIKGTVMIGSLNAPNTITLNTLQSVSVVGQTVGAVQNISPAMAVQVLKNLKAPQQFTESDEGTKKKVSKVEQAKALALAQTLVGGQGQSGGGDAGGGDAALAEASSGASSPSGPGTGSLTTTTTTLGSLPPIVSTTQQTQAIQQIINPPRGQIIGKVGGL
jgi:FecR-like protein